MPAIKIQSSPVLAGERAVPVPVEKVRQLGRDPLRAEAELMQPRVLGALQPSALSCSRYFIERMFAQGWRIEQTSFAIDAVGAGIARYSIHACGKVFEFVALSNPPVDGGRSGRVLDGGRDMNAGLYEGLASDGQIEAMRREMPKIYSGRAEGDTLIWCRSNRSMRIFEHVVERLAAGLQPDPASIAETGYLMRNVGIEGNGVYGTRAFGAYGRDHPLALPYMAQMLAAYMMREFAFDLAEHLARVASPSAAALSMDFKRFIGIGNGSAIGLVFFVYNRPAFIGRWLEMRERLAAAAASLKLDRTDPCRTVLGSLLEKAAIFAVEDRIGRTDATERARYCSEIGMLRDRVCDAAAAVLDLGELVEQATHSVSTEALDTFLSCCMELLPELRDALLDCFFVDEEPPPSPLLDLDAIVRLIRRDYGWALQMDMSGEDANYFVWYQSVSNDEPRRGTRHDTPSSINMLRNIAAGVTALLRDIERFGQERPMADFLRAHPQHRYMIQRLELLADQHFHTPHCNPFDRTFVALSLVKLVMVGFYGLQKPVDFLDRNSRGIMFHGAPARDELGGRLDPGWFYPLLPGAAR